MGNFVSNLLAVFNRTTSKKVLMVGLDNAGKTTILYKFKEKGLASETSTTIPTVGFNVENIKIGNVTITMWDIGGQKKIRTLWAFYAEGLAGLVYVIDIEDSTRWENAVDELKKILNKDIESSGKRYPVLVLANKIDIIERITKEEAQRDLVKALEPNKLFAGRPWRIALCSAKMGGLSDIAEPFMWLAKHLIE